MRSHTSEPVGATGGTVSPETRPGPSVVVAVDGSGSSYHATAWAATEAGLRHRPLRIVISVGVPRRFGPALVLSEEDLGLLRAEGDRVLTEAARVARVSGGETLAIDTEITDGPIVPDLIDRSLRAVMLVVGSRGLGAIRRGLLGSVSSAITRHAHCPVAVVHSSSATDPVSAGKPVLVGVDGTANSVPAVELAFAEASWRKVGLTAMHVWSDTSGIDLPLAEWEPLRQREGAVLGESLAGFGERYPEVSVGRILMRDRPVRALLDESDNAQLLVTGSHGRGGFTGMLLGSTSTALLHSVECPMIVVRDGRAKPANRPESAGRGL
ncbi:universal stress protein [Nocardia brevicatena]|uniref:universal stress protein n=1 Tax=Nocardia brevicatena TaxID=37327 RepID=UPI00031815EC|nr:universal stress protein [Nocardia brevicatena]